MCSIYHSFNIFIHTALGHNVPKLVIHAPGTDNVSQILGSFGRCFYIAQNTAHRQGSAYWSIGGSGPCLQKWYVYNVHSHCVGGLCPLGISFIIVAEQISLPVQRSTLLGPPPTVSTNCGADSNLQVFQTRYFCLSFLLVCLIIYRKGIPFDEDDEILNPRTPRAGSPEVEEPESYYEQHLYQNHQIPFPILERRGSLPVGVLDASFVSYILTATFLASASRKIVPSL